MPVKPDILRPALLGGLTISLMWIVPILSLVNCFCCAGVLLGGFVAVSLYRKNKINLTEQMQIQSPTIELTYPEGIKVGLMSGAFGAIFSTISNAILKVYTKQSIEEMIDSALKMWPTMPADIEEALLNFSANYNDLFFISLSLIMSLIIFCIFGMLGGMLGVSILNRKRSA